MSTERPAGPSPLDPEALAQVEHEARAAIAAADSLDALHEVRLAHHGDRSPIALANRAIGSVEPAQKKAAGQNVGAVRTAISAALATRQAELEAERDAEVLVDEAVDVTLPWDREPRGARHPLTMMLDRIADVFVAMGYEIAEGPELEAEWFNFDALNIPPDHPARTMMDTFFVTSPDSGLVMRTHTSPVQARVMLTQEPPIYVVAPGRVYRTDELDATHTPVFHQVEGLVVDEGITMAHLRGTLDHLVGAVRRGAADPLAPVVLPVHRAVGRVRRRVLRVPGRLGRQPRPAVPDVLVRGLDRVGRLRHGQPAGARRLRHRPRPLHRVRLRHGPRTHPAVPARRRGHARHGRRRRALQPCRSGWTSDARAAVVVARVRRHPGGESGRDVAERLVRAGLEVESVTSGADEISGPLIVGEVISFDEEEHSNGKTIRWCQVSDRGGRAPRHRLRCAQLRGR